MTNWYKVEVNRAHLGNNCNETVAYIFAEDVRDVLTRYKKMPGVRRDFSPKHRVPEILLLPEKDALELERKIIDEKIIPLKKAKKTWYYDKLI